MNRLLLPILSSSLVALCQPSIAVADWREEIGTFRVALAANGDAATTAMRAEPFRLSLEAALGMPVEIVPAKDYAALIDAASRSRIEYAILSANAYSAAWAACECVEPLVIAASGDGSSAFRQNLFVRAGGPVSLVGLKGRKIAVIDTGAVGGELLAMHELRLQGLDLSSDAVELVRFAASNEAVAAFASGTVDALLGWSPDPATSSASRGTLAAIALSGADPSQFRSIWQSSALPNRVHAIRRNLDAEAKTLLRSLLSSLFSTDPVAYDSVEPVHGGGFLAARQSQFEALAAMFRERGISAAIEKK